MPSVMSYEICKYFGPGILIQYLY